MIFVIALENLYYFITGWKPVININCLENSGAIKNSD